MVKEVNADRDWIGQLEAIFCYGHKSSPRGMPIYEALAAQSVVSMHNPIIYNPVRKLGYKFMAAEAAWILDGRDDVASIAPYSKDISKFSDNGETFYGAYGPRLKHQFDHVMRTIAGDWDTRQAVATIWRQNPVPSKDIPCTVSLQWLVRDGEIHCNAGMRSSDLWLGHPYDIFNFSAYTFAIMIELNKLREAVDLKPLELGYLYLTSGSKHLYERNVEGVSEILKAHGEKGMYYAAGRRDVFKAHRYTSKEDFIEHLWSCAESSGGAQELEN